MPKSCLNTRRFGLRPSSVVMKGEARNVWYLNNFLALKYLLTFFILIHPSATQYYELLFVIYFLIKTMLYRAYRLSSTWKAFTDECEFLKVTFAQLRYPTRLIDSTIKAFIHDQTINNRSSLPNENSQEEPIRITFPFKDQRSADNARKNNFNPWAAKSACAYNQFSQAEK